MNKLKILIVGCGKMGFALLQGFINSGVSAGNITVIEPAKNENLERLGVRLFTDNKDLPDDFDFCIFAIKPQNFDEAVAEYKFLSEKCVFLSIAAGKTIKKMNELLGNDAAIVRAMPNLPATVSAGITALCFNDKVNNEQKRMTISLLGTVGETVTISDEKQLDLITAISGSGPAYIFHVIESLYNIGVNMGLENETALKLAKNTVYGSGKLAYESNKSPEELRIDVTSPKGTTEAALKVLMGENRMQDLLSKAVQAAEKRSQELS